MKINEFGFAIVVLAASIGCQPRDLEAPAPGECRELTESFFRKFSISEKMTKFHDFNIEKQYVIYICGNQREHPPSLYLAEAFAKEGEQVVSFLTGKLSATKSDSTVRDIISVFSDMQNFKTYDVASNEILMAIIINRAAGIKDDFWREYTQNLVAEIKAARPAGPRSH
jgi:hypothetical protein